MNAMALIFYLCTAAVVMAGGSWMYWNRRIRQVSESSGFASGGKAIESPQVSILKLRRTKSVFAMLIARGVSVTLLQLSKTSCFLSVVDGNGNAICEITSDGTFQPVRSDDP